MDKLEKGIKGLECCSQGAKEPYTPTIRYCAECPYLKSEIPCTRALARDALELLKAQEPKKLRCIRRLTKVMKGICPVCEMEIESVIHGRITKFCKFCGQAVKWDGETEPC